MTSPLPPAASSGSAPQGEGHAVDPRQLYLADLPADEQLALGRVLKLEQALMAQAPAADLAPRLVARIRAAQGDERAAQQRRRLERARARPVWVRVLVASLGLHAAALVVLALLAHRAERQEEHGPALRSEWIASTERLPESADLGWNLSQLDAPRMADLPDDLLLRGQETLHLEEMLLAEPHHAGPARLYDHPAEVTLAMARRRDERLKRRTLALLGLDADGTLHAVRKGLNWLGARQEPDGSFAPEGGATAREQTAIALLPFLGEAYCSTSQAGPVAVDVVRNGVAWLREAAFPSGTPATAQMPAREAGAVAVALSEDYMLSFARLSVAEAARRRAELDALRQRLEGDGQAAAEFWGALGRDALARAGIAATAPGSWGDFTEASVAEASEGAGRAWALQAYMRGAALLLAERGAEKPGFRAWGAANAQLLLDALLPTGRVRTGPEVSGTALVLLALQAAYRTL